MKTKQIELKSLPETAPGANDALDYRTLLDIQFNKTGAGGLTVGELTKRISLIESLKSSADYFTLSSADHKQLVEDLSKEHWAKVSANIVTFVQDIADAEDTNAPTVVSFEKQSNDPVE